MVGLPLHEIIRGLSRLVALPAMLLLMGCSKFPSTTPVSGVITYQGQPVAGATVTFSRGNGDRSKGDVAVGQTDALGHYQLMTHFDGQTSVSGVVPGEYKVTLSKPVPPRHMSAAQYQALVDAAMKAGEQGLTLPPDQQPPPMVELFPPTISAPNSTKLTVPVERGREEYNLSLEPS